MRSQQLYPYEYFKEFIIYDGEEETSKKLKQVLLLGNFSGKSILAIEQDFYEKILFENFISILSNGIEKQITQKILKKTKYNSNKLKG